MDVKLCALCVCGVAEKKPVVRWKSDVDEGRTLFVRSVSHSYADSGGKGNFSLFTEVSVPTHKGKLFSICTDIFWAQLNIEFQLFELF